nr:hypothetical protein [Tanacetum cinerariifolium]
MGVEDFATWVWGTGFTWGVGGVVWYYSDWVRCTVGFCREDGGIGKLGEK